MAIGVSRLDYCNSILAGLAKGLLTNYNGLTMLLPDLPCNLTFVKRGLIAENVQWF